MRCHVLRASVTSLSSKCPNLSVQAFARTNEIFRKLRHLGPNTRQIRLAIPQPPADTMAGDWFGRWYHEIARKHHCPGSVSALRLGMALKRLEACAFAPITTTGRRLSLNTNLETNP